MRKYTKPPGSDNMNRKLILLICKLHKYQYKVPREIMQHFHVALFYIFIGKYYYMNISQYGDDYSRVIWHIFTKIVNMYFFIVFDYFPHGRYYGLTTTDTVQGGNDMKNERYELNKNLAQMLKGGVIMDVTTPEQAKIAEAAGACAVMALERIPADIRAAGGVSRMSDPKMIKGIQEAVSIPVMAKCRIGHFAEAQILQAIEIDYIDESEVLSPADDKYHIDKTAFDVPFVCGAKDLGEALRRINEGASMIRTKGEPGTGDVVQAVRHMRMMQSEIRRLVSMSADELFDAAKELRVPYDLVLYVHENGKLPVVNFAAGGVATPADASLMMQLGAEGVFVGSGIFKSGNPEKRAAAIVKAVTNYTDAKLIAELSEDLGEAMVGINEQEIELLMAERGK